MAFIVGEVDLSPSSINKLNAQARQPVSPVGTRHILLDSVRDADFLASASIVNPDGSHDAGLGVVDNGLFFYTSAIDPTTGNPRLYPFKFLWIGSPEETNDSNDMFSIYIADANQGAFYPSVTADSWLVNPRLLLHVDQAKTDIVNWFDSNYPGGANGGEGNGNSGANANYGSLAGGESVAGNVSQTNSIDGQFWPVYDYVDNSILLYFSIKTPNVNTKSIYCYKTMDTEFGSPLVSSQFLGGVFGAFGGFSNVCISSHRFSIVSPDPLVTMPRVAGQQSALFAYAYGTLDGATADHALFLQAGFIPDIHEQPLNWSQPGGMFVPSGGLGLDYGGLNNVDKIGSIIPVGDVYSASCYCVLFNCTSTRDARINTNKVIINSMQVRCAFLQLNSISPHFLYGSEPLLELTGFESVGHCRPQYTTFPDGRPKIVCNDFQFDQSLKAVYEYIDSSKLRPENHSQLIYTNDVTPNPFLLKTYGKKRALIILGQAGQTVTNDSQNQPTVVELSAIYGNMDASTGSYNGTIFNIGSLLLSAQVPEYSLDGSQNGYTSEAIQGIFEVEDLAPYLRVKAYGNQTYTYAVVELRD